MDPLDLISQGKVKRFFRATRKITAPKVISHLTQRAAGKQPLFASRMTSCLFLPACRVLQNTEN
jgi:putative transposase